MANAASTRWVTSLKAMGKSMASILDFGAHYDGTDETAILQSAIDHVNGQGGGVVDIPAFGSNVLRVDGRIILKADVCLSVAHGVTVDCSRHAGTSSSFFAAGSLGTAVDIAVPVGSGAVTLETKTDHGLAPGDWIYLKSQRACLHDDAGPAWRLGAVTARTLQPFFAEPLQVLAIETPTRFTVTAGILFPGYRPDRAEETYEEARPSATIQKIDWIRGIKVKGGVFLKSESAAVVSLFAFDLCLAPCVEDVECKLGYQRGAAILESACLRGVFRARASRPFDWVLDEQEQARLNSYRDIGGWYCEWDVEDVYGCQGWDQSYTGGGHPCLFPRVKLRAFDSRKEGCTTHGGAYGALIEAEVVRPRGTGVYNRARFSTIRCRVIGEGGETESVGVTLSGWGALDVQLMAPYIQQVGIGIEVRHAIGEDTAPPETNLVITDPTIIGTSGYALAIYGRSQPTSEDAKIRLSGLTARDCAYGVVAGDFVNGIVVDNMEIIRLGMSSTPRYGLRLRGAGHSVRGLRGHDIGENNSLLYIGGFPSTSQGDALRTKYGVTAQVDWASVRLYGAGKTAQVAGTMKSLVGATYTLSRVDAGTMIAFRSNAAVSCMVPDAGYAPAVPDPGVPAGAFDIPLGAEIAVVQQGAGPVTFQAQAGVTLLSASGLTTTGSGAVARLSRIGLATWLLSGDVA